MNSPRSADPPSLSEHPFSRIEVSFPDEGIALATLNRPESLNAVDELLHRELCTIFEVADRDPAVRVLVLTGAGRGFSVGGDLEMMASTASSAEATLDLLADGRRVIAALLDCGTPVVAAVNGIAMGIGCQIALLSDVCVAGRSARFSDGHVIAGVAAGDGGALIWPLLVGMSRAKRYLLTGEQIDSATAESLGMITEAVEDEALQETALAWAQRLAQGPPHAIRATKQVLNQWLALGRLISLDYGLAAESLNFLTADARDRIDGLRDRSGEAQRK